MNQKQLLALTLSSVCLLFTGCGKQTLEELQTKEIPIVYENAEVKLAQYTGNVVQGVDGTKEPTEEEIDEEYALICVYAMENSKNSDFFENTDAWVASHFTNLSTVAELRDAVKQSLMGQNTINSPYLNRKAAIEFVQDNSVIDYKA